MLAKWSGCQATWDISERSQFALGSGRQFTFRTILMTTPPWYDSPDFEQLTVPTMRQGMTAFLITGDSARNKVQTMPGGGCSTLKIELPKNWDELMNELGYEPIKKFFLK